MQKTEPDLFPSSMDETTARTEQTTSAPSTLSAFAPAIAAVRPTQPRKSTRPGRPRTCTIVIAETTATSPHAARPPQQPASEPEVLRITLNETQAAILNPLLDKHRHA